MSNEVVMELDLAKNIKEQLETDIKTLQARKENLEGQVRQAQIQLEAEKKYKNVELNRQYEGKEEEFEKRENKLNILKDSLELKEKSIEDRIKNVEAQEKKVGIYEELMKNLDKERRDFMVYKTNVEKELEKARITIEESKHIARSYEKEEQSLINRERNIQMKELALDKQLGEFYQRVKEFELKESALK